MAEPWIAHRTEIDGIPTFWAPGDSDGIVGGLLFRVGWADEPYVQSGITHLVEHLALNAIGQTAYGWNGSVDHLVTTLAAKGTVDEVADFLQTATRALSAVPVERLSNETRVLRTEAQERRRGPLDQLLIERYGVIGYGRRPTADEWFLWHAEAGSIAAWTARYFTRENAALWFYGEPPARLSLELPSGGRQPPPTPVPLTGVPMPHWHPSGGRGSGVAMGMIFDRTSPAGSFMLPLIAERLQNELRLGPGIVRQVTPGYLALDRQTAHGSLAASCLDEDAATVAQAVITTIQRVAQEGLTDAEFILGRERYRRGAADEQTRPGLAATAAHRHLTGAAEMSVAQLQAQVDALSANDVASAVAAALPEAIIIVPSGASEPVPPFKGPPGFHDPPVSGVTYALAPAQGPSPAWPRLVIGPTAVSYSASADDVMTIQRPDVVGYFTGEAGVRTIIRRDGSSLRLALKTWAQGETLERSLEALMPAGVTLDVSFQNPGGTPPAAAPATYWTTGRGLRPKPIRMSTAILIAALAAVAIIATGVLTNAPAPTQTLAPIGAWQRQTAPGGDFSILLPGVAQALTTMLPASEEPIPAVVLDWASQNPRVEFLATESSVGQTQSDPTTLLKRVQADQVGAGTIVDSRSGFVQGYPDLDFSYGVNDQLDFVRDIVVHGHLYQLEALGYPNVDPRTAEAFFDTIEFISP